MTFRRIAALAVLVLYLLPPGLGLLSRLSHEVEHALEGTGAPAVPPATAALVHSHDGSTHAHGTAVEALVSAAAALDPADDEEEEAGLVPPPLLLGLVATPPPDLRFSIETHPGGPPWTVDLPRGPGPPPPLPPPRG